MYRSEVYKVYTARMLFLNTNGLDDQNVGEQLMVDARMTCMYRNNILAHDIEYNNSLHIT